MVFDLPCYPDLAQTPHIPDLAILVIPRRHVPPVLQQCIELGVKAVLIISAGFAEADDEGRRLQAEITALLDGATPAVIGPNCAGLANIPDRVVATLLTTPPKAGAISLVSQSGALMMALYGLFAERNLGLSHIVSLGNQVDVTLAESLLYLAQEPQTAVIGAFVEGIRDGRMFVRALQEALLAGKPIVLVKSGRTAAGRAAAATHTAALAGSDRVFSAVCSQFGVIQVDDVDEMLDTIELLAAFGDRLSGRRLAIVTQSGGMGSLAADFCQRAGLELPPLSAAVQERLHALTAVLQFGDLGNPADVRGAGAKGPALADTLQPFLEDEQFDMALLLLAKSTLRAGEDETAEAIIQAVQAAEKPLIVVWTGQRGRGEPGVEPATGLLREAGVPVFDSPGRAIRAAARVADYRQFRTGWLAENRDSDA